MADNDSHYNGTPNINQMEPEFVTPLSTNEGGAVYSNISSGTVEPVLPLSNSEDNSLVTTSNIDSTASEPVIPLPNPGEGGPVYPGNGFNGHEPVIPLPNPGEGGPVYPGNGSNGYEPVIPLPNPGEGGPVYPGNDSNGNEPVIPLPNPGEGGPVYPGNDSNGHEPVIPLPNPGEGGPAYPGNDSNGHEPVIPLPNPGEGGPAYPGNGPFYPGNGGITWTPICPSAPNCPPISSRQFGQVRFLNASTNNFAVNISIDSTSYAMNSRFGSVTGYDWISDGFHTVTVRRASGMRSILLQQTFPFVANEKVTMVLTDSASGGLEMIRVVDTGCTNLPAGSGCYRFANMSYNGSTFDLLLNGGEVVFRGVGFQNVTTYKQAVAGSYQFNVVESNNFTFIRELPIIVIGAVATGTSIRQPQVSFSVNISAGRNYTSYVIGNTWSSGGLRVLTVED